MDIDYLKIGQPLTLKDFQQMEEIKHAYLVENLIPKNGITAIVGEPGSGKTWLYLLMAKSIISGNDFLDKFSVEPSNILIIEEENGEITLKPRIDKIFGEEEFYNEIYFYSRRGIKLDDELYIDHLIHFIKENNIGVVILDPIRDLFSGDENSSRDVHKIMSSLTELLRLGVTIIYTHHPRKGMYAQKTRSSDLRGSSVFLGKLDSLIIIDSEKQADEISLVIRNGKGRQGKEFKPFKAVIKVDESSVDIEYFGDQEPEKNKAEKAKDIIFDLLNSNEDGVLGEAIKEVLQNQHDISPRTTHTALKEMEDDDWFIKTEKIGKKKVYKLNQSQDSKNYENDGDSLFPVIG